MFFLIATLLLNLANVEKTAPDTYRATIDVPVPQGDALYADYILFSVDSPAIALSDWRPSIEPISKYDPTFKVTKSMFTKPFQIQIDAILSDPTIASATLHAGYYVQSEHKNQSAFLKLSFAQEGNLRENTEESLAAPIAPIVCQKKIEPPHSLSTYLSSLLQKTDSLSIKLLLSLLLGIFLSLTPCIYPMIPITMGILQSQASRSLWRNFSLAFTYTMGIATTFAMLGVLAAFTGQMFGTIMNNPIVIIAIVLMLLYLAGSMLGLYEMYLPRILQNSSGTTSGGSYISAFLFGAASGTIASPCLSPGLVLLLTLVTSIGSIPIGFLLLFFFGLGLGMPLLLIGTFSSSLTMMPKAGMWMVDIKQFFGFIMVGTCFYFLSTLVPLYILSWAIALFIIAVGIFYIRASNQASGTGRTIKNILGVFFVAFGVYSLFTAYKTIDLNAAQDNCATLWECDYQQGLCRALQEKKLVLLDISAPYCSICKAIERKHFNNSAVIDALADYVTIKIDDIEKDDCTRALQQQFTVLGAPTLILVDPAHNVEIKRWGGELYDLSPEQFAKELIEYKKECPVIAS